MKKLLGIIFLSLLLCNSVLADVYYCVDKAITGFKHENGDYRVAKYRPEKFKAKIDFDESTFESKDINMDYQVSCLKLSSQKYSMTCASSFGDVFTIEGDKSSIDSFDYIRGKTFGRTDSIYITYGNCEKF